MFVSQCNESTSRRVGTQTCYLYSDQSCYQQQLTLPYKAWQVLLSIRIPPWTVENSIKIQHSFTSRQCNLKNKKDAEQLKVEVHLDKWIKQEQPKIDALAALVEEWCGGQREAERKESSSSSRYNSHFSLSDRPF